MCLYVSLAYPNSVFFSFFFFEEHPNSVFLDEQVE